MISSIISRIVILVFGTLYPAYASYKAVKTKNIKEYLKWMMYWIVFALFTCIETFTDIFLSWFPFYYEIKILLVLWLLSPATKGSSILYRKFVHPMFSSKEEEIDEYIAKAKEQSYKQVLDLGQKGVTALMQTALKSMNAQDFVQRVFPQNSDESDGKEKNLQKDQHQAANFAPKNDEITTVITSSQELYQSIAYSDDDEELLYVENNKKTDKSKGRVKKPKNSKIAKRVATRQTIQIEEDDEDDDN